ncbi:hypothetical protein [Candidatus Thiosymbion oneisti]|uniref:hypothetical protein n=1 Tax=Candidatus Thiosymbion oneisti TaxID=589554 RepID=UPI0010608B76|nr:hypothetical protein [Candidatus Thiosymbion oneisti]
MGGQRFEGSISRPAIPFLTLADVFIGAVSIVFVLLLLADPERVRVQHPPQADYRLVCSKDGVRLVTEGEVDGTRPEVAALAPDSPALRTQLSLLEVPTALSVRVLIRTPPALIHCAEQVADVIAELNKSLSERLMQGGQGSYLLYDMEVVGDVHGIEAVPGP